MIHRIGPAILGSLLFAFGCADPDNQGAPGTGENTGGEASGSGGGAGEGGAGANGTGGTPGWPNEPLGFNPSNVDLAGENQTTVGEISIAAPCTIQTDEGRIDCAEPESYTHRIVEWNDAYKFSVFVARSIAIEKTGSLTTLGSLPLVLISLEDMTLHGSILVAPGTAGGATNQEANEVGSGPGGGAPGGSMSAANGASFCGLGALGAAKPGSTAGFRGPTYGSEDLFPLVAGSSGGVGGVVPVAGQGGGAIQLVAGGTFQLSAGAFVSAGGGGGRAGASGSGAASGGGSGGAILIEAPVVSIEGTLAVNGGGGGQGIGDDGQSGRADAMTASGGAKETNGTVIGRGGDGSAGNDADASDGTLSSAGEPGAGGGGAGRIRINTTSGTANLEKALLSPAASTTCTTVGLIN